MMGLLNLQGLAAKSQSVAKAPCFSLLIVTKRGWDLAEGKWRVSWREAQPLCIQYPLLCFIFPIWISPAKQQADAQMRAQCQTAEEARGVSPVTFGIAGPLCASGLVPRVIVIYTRCPFGGKMVLIKCIPHLLSLAQPSTGSWLGRRKRQWDLHISLQDSFNLLGIYWPSIRTVKYCLLGT